MDKECKLGIMEILTKVSLYKGFLRALEYIVVQMDQNIKAIEWKIKNMVKEYGHQEMEILMKVSMWEVWEKDMEFLGG